MKRARVSRHACALRPAGAGPSYIMSPQVETTPGMPDSLSVPATDSPSVICSMARAIPVCSFEQIASLEAKRQEHISRPCGDAAIAGVHEDHAVRHDQWRAIDTRAGGFNAVYGREFLVRVELPENGTIRRGVRANTTVV